jgi:ABC-type glycerol-3-phosphate transport system permease component
MKTTKRTPLLQNLSLVLPIALACLFVLIPIYWTVNTSLKVPATVVSFPPKWLPQPFSLESYVNIITESVLPRNYLNSVILVAGTMALVLAIGVPAGYAAARYEFKGRNAILFLLMMTVMIPGIVTLIPQYFLAVRLGLYDSYLVLILIYGAWQVPTVIWIMRGFFQNIPRELDESAQVDGCSRIGAFYRVVLPISVPGIAAAAIVVFVWVWNEFIIALNMTASNATRPLTVGLYFFIGETGIQWGGMSAGAAMALLPVILAFIFLQRRFVEGLTAGSVKG